MNVTKLIIFFIVIFFGVQPFSCAIEDESELFRIVTITDGSILSVEDCVALAFSSSPRIRRQKYNLDIAKSNVGIAKSAYFPVISAGVGFYNENNSDNIYYNSHYRELPSVGVSINKLVWDFGKTSSYIKMEKFYQIGAEYEFLDSICSTLFDIKAKYYNLLKTKALFDIADENIKINQEFVKNARAKVDLTTAKLNLSDAKVAYIEAQNNYENAKTDLSNSMYLDEKKNYDIKNTPTFTYKKPINGDFTPQKLGFEKGEAVEIAYANSPDLRVLEATKNAMEQSLAYIKKVYYPELNASAGYGLNNSNQVTNNNFQVGVNLTSSVNIMALKHSISGGEAQINLAENEIMRFKKDLYFEVEKALNNEAKSEKRVPVAKTEAMEASENLDVVRNLYSKGQIDYVALQNSRKDYINALSRYVNAMYDYNMSLIQVEMAMHYHIVDIHHKTEHAIHYHSEDLIKHLNEVLDCTEEHKHKIKKHFL